MSQAMRAWREDGGLGRFPEGGGFATGFWQIWEDKAEKVNWVQVRKTLACQVRTLIGSGDSWRGDRPDGLLTISVQSSRDTDIWTSDSFLEIGRCYWPEGVVFSVSILYLETESLVWPTGLFSVSQWTLDLPDFPWVSEMVMLSSELSFG